MVELKNYDWMKAYIFVVRIFKVHTFFQEAQTMIDAKSELYHPCNLITVIFASPLYEYKH